MTPVEVITLVIGILSAALVLLSYIFTNQKTLRIVNLAASILFVIYGIGLLYTAGDGGPWTGYTAIPTILLNACCCAVHVYYLFFKKTKFDNAESRQPDEQENKSTNRDDDVK